jgi:activator of HSP90 ATPase
MIGDNVTDYEKGVEDVINWIENAPGRKMTFQDFPRLIREELIQPYRERVLFRYQEQKLQRLSDRIEELEKRQRD